MAELRRAPRPGAPLRREPAPVCGALPCRRQPARRRHRPAGAGQGALLQQYQRHRRRLRAGRRVRPGEAPAVAIIKHANPCGVAEGESLVDAYRKALRCDPVSAYRRHRRAQPAARRRGGDRDRPSIFTEVIIAPEASDEAMAIVAAKKNLRLLVAGGLPDPRAPGLTVRAVAGGPPRPGSRQRHGGGERAEGRHPARADRRRDPPTCCSPGGSPSTSSRTPSSMPRIAPRWASAPAR